MPDFHESLMMGKKVEQMFLLRLKRKYNNPIIIEGSFKPFDIYVPDNHKRWEVKSDMKSNYTGNYLIEVEHYGKPSALMTTEAEYWVLYDSCDWVVCSPIKIKDLILSNNYRLITTIGKGDDYAKKCYLIPKKDIQVIANQIVPCEEHEILNAPTRA